MADLLRLLAWCACVIIIGWSVLSLISRKNIFSLAETAALSYGIGLGLMSLEMAALSIFNIKFSVLSIMIFWVPLIVWAAPAALKRLKMDRPISKMMPLSALEKFFIFGISLEAAYTFFKALVRPIEAYDAIAIYGLKSKIFYLAGGVGHNFFSAFKDFVPHIEYPLLIPLAETSVYTFLGSLNDILVKAIFPLFYLSLLILVYSLARRFIERKPSLLVTFLLATIPQLGDFATNGYADIAFTFYCSSSIFYLFLWARERKGTLLIISFVMSILAMWTKSEGLMFAGINILLTFIYMLYERKFVKNALLYSVMLMIIAVAYVALVSKLSGTLPQGDFSKPAAAGKEVNLADIRRIFTILYEYQIQLFGPKKWNMIWVLFLAGFFLCLKNIFSKNMAMLTFAIILAFCGYTAVYMISPDLSWHLSKSASRVFIHFLPVVVLWLALIYKEKQLEI